MLRIKLFRKVNDQLGTCRKESKVKTGGKLKKAGEMRESWTEDKVQKAG